MLNVLLRPDEGVRQVIPSPRRGMASLMTVKFGADVVDLDHPASADKIAADIDFISHSEFQTERDRYYKHIFLLKKIIRHITA